MHAPGADMRIRQVKVQGNARTRPEVFETELASAIDAVGIDALTMELEYSMERLAALNIFDTITMKIDKCKDSDDKELDVIIAVKEKDWKDFGFLAKSGELESFLEGSCTLVNSLGTGERVEAAATYGSLGSHSQCITFSKSQFMSYPYFFRAKLHNQMQNFESLSSYKEKIHGGSAQVSDYSDVHTIQLHCDQRNVLPKHDKRISTAYQASPSILAECRPSTKTSVEYSFRCDTRDNPFLPLSGCLLRSSTELAGLFGDTQFVKHQCSVQKHKSLFIDKYNRNVIGLRLKSQFGILKSFGNRDFNTCQISDRFFLGGISSLRGFNHHGIGPRANPVDGGTATGDALGGNLTYSASADVTFPLPILSALGIQGQIFANLGNLTMLDQLKKNGGWLKSLISETRLSAGLGLVLPTEIGLIEASYSWILKASKMDHIARGQIGIEVSIH